MSKYEKENLKLIGNSPDDLGAISAYIQDSIVTIGDIVFLKKNRIFIILMNRFMWENSKKETNAEKKRIRCAIKFEGILEAKSKKINQKNKNKRLECLAIRCKEIISKNYEITFLFAGGGLINLISESIDVVMNDLGEAWNVKYIPKHKIWMLIYLRILIKTRNGEIIG